MKDYLIAFLWGLACAWVGGGIIRRWRSRQRNGPDDHV
jgi:hypothetical protein